MAQEEQDGHQDTAGSGANQKIFKIFIKIACIIFLFVLIYRHQGQAEAHQPTPTPCERVEAVRVFNCL